MQMDGAIKFDFLRIVMNSFLYQVPISTLDNNELSDEEDSIDRLAACSSARTDSRGGIKESGTNRKREGDKTKGNPIPIPGAPIINPKKRKDGSEEGKSVYEPEIPASTRSSKGDIPGRKSRWEIREERRKNNRKHTGQTTTA